MTRALILIVLCLLASLHSSVCDSVPADEPGAVPADEPAAAPEFASSGWCKYCKYAQFCPKCEKSCPCTEAMKKTSSTCQYCGYCKFCPAAEQICGYCHKDGVLDKIGSGVGYGVGYLQKHIEGLLGLSKGDAENLPDESEIAAAIASDETARKQRKAQQRAAKANEEL